MVTTMNRVVVLYVVSILATVAIAATLASRNSNVALLIGFSFAAWVGGWSARDIWGKKSSNKPL
jgi:hypothetical protein